MALGSLFELETQLILAGRLTYLDENNLEVILSKIDEVGRMLRGLQKSLKSKL
jgi:four helix bundle protein